MARLLIIAGVILVILGVAWPWLGRLGLGRLPGDIVWRQGGVTVYVPIVTCVILSVVLTLVLWLINR